MINILDYRQPNQEVSIMGEYTEFETQDLMNSFMLGYDYSGLLATLSSKYCMCELFGGYVDYQPASAGLVDLTRMLDQDSGMQRARNNLSTLKIPKASYATNSDEQLTPTTFEASPSLKTREEGSFREYSKEAFNLQVPLSTPYLGF